MRTRTGTEEVFWYIKEDLGLYWTEWVEIHITGYSTPSHSHSPLPPVWTRIEVFNVKDISHLSDSDGLVAMRDEAIHRGRVYNMPYLQVVVIVRPPV